MLFFSLLHNNRIGSLDFNIFILLYYYTYIYIYIYIFINNIISSDGSNFITRKSFARYDK